MHENDIKLLQNEKKTIMIRLAEIERQILISSQYNREMKGRENINEDYNREIKNNKF